MQNEDLANALALPSVMFFLLICFVILLLPTIFFLLTLQRTLARCDPSSRTMSPGHVWLGIVPFFGVIWNFFIVNAISNSLRNEFTRRGIVAEPQPGRSIGLAWAILILLSMVPFVNFLTGIPALICWILYWVKVAEFLGKLSSPIAAAPAV